jgi:hypothetical protein
VVNQHNWDPTRGAHPFVTEGLFDGLRRDTEALADVHAYARDVALWLATRSRSPRRS